MRVVTREPLRFLASFLLFLTPVLCDVSHSHDYPRQDRFISERHDRLSPSSSLIAPPTPRRQRSNPQHYQDGDGKYDFSGDQSGWDIRLSVPGEPERDYPLLNSIPQTSFNCAGKTDGYYADIETRCQVFRVCAITAVGGFFSFLCPNGTLFNQKVLVCDWWMNVDCPNFDSEIEANEKFIMPTGSALMNDIRQMITYPTKVPAPNTDPPMKTSMQVYNPPVDMFPPSQFQYRPQNGGQESRDLKLPIDSFNPTRNGDNSNSINKDPSQSVLDFRQSPSFTKYEGIIPNNRASLPIYESDLANVGTQKAVDLNVQKVFNAQQATKVTKQQFTYPSAYDKQYTVPPIPTTNSQPSLVVRVPINVAAFDETESGVPFEIGKEEYSKQVNTFEQRVGGFKNNFQEMSGSLSQNQINDQSISGKFLTAQEIQNGQNAANLQFNSVYKSKLATSVPYAEENREEKNSDVTTSDFFQVNRGSLQNSGQQKTFEDYQQSNFARENEFNRGATVMDANQYSSKFSKDSTSFISGGADEFNKNTLLVSEFENSSKQVTAQHANYESQDNSHQSELKKQKEETQFGNHPNIPQRAGKLTFYGTNESGPGIEREYPSQFDTSSGRSPIITEIENQGEFFSIQEGPRRPTNRRPQQLITKPKIGESDQQISKSNGEAVDDNKSPNAQDVKQPIKANRFSGESETGIAFSNNQQSQKYYSGDQIQRQNKNHQNEYGQFTSTEIQAKNNAAHTDRGGVKTNTQSEQFNHQRFTSASAKKEGLVPQGDKYSDGRLVSVQQQFPFIGPNHPSPFVKSTQRNENVVNQQTSQYATVGSTQTSSPQVSKQDYSGIKSRQNINTDLQSGIETYIHINKDVQESVLSEYAKQTMNDLPLRTEYNREFSLTETSGGRADQSEKFTEDVMYSKQDQISSNYKFDTSAVNTAVTKFDGPISGEYNREVTYKSNIQSAPIVSRNYAQESLLSKQNLGQENYNEGSFYSKQERLGGDHQLRAGVVNAVDSKFGSTSNTGPVSNEYNQETYQLNMKSKPVVSAVKYTQDSSFSKQNINQENFDKDVSYSEQDQRSGNYQYDTGVVSTAISKFKSTSNTSPVSNTFTEITYNSNEQPVPDVSSGKYRQESSFTKQNQFSNNYQSGSGVSISSNNKFLSNHNTNGALKSEQYKTTQNSPAAGEYKQQFLYSSHRPSAPPTNSEQFISTQETLRSMQGKLQNNYQGFTATQNSGSRNIKTNSQHTQNNKYSNTATSSSPYTQIKQSQTYSRDNQRGSPVISSRDQFLTQQKQTSTFMSTPLTSGSFVSTDAAHNENRNQKSIFYTNSENYRGLQDKNVQGQYQSNFNGGESSGGQEFKSSLKPQNDNEYSGRLTSQVRFGGSSISVPSAQENVNFNYENRVNYNTGAGEQINNRNTQTKIEVVPAYGFLLNSDREKQEYFTAITQGLSNVHKIYEAPYRQSEAYTSSSASSGLSSGDANFRFHQRAQTSNYQSPNYIPQPSTANVDRYRGQTNERQQSTVATPHRPLPLEDLGGYPRERPSISFSY